MTLLMTQKVQQVTSARLNVRYRKPCLRFKPELNHQKQIVTVLKRKLNELTKSMKVCTSTPHCRVRILLVMEMSEQLASKMIMVERIKVETMNYTFRIGYTLNYAFNVCGTSIHPETRWIYQIKPKETTKHVKCAMQKLTQK